MSNKPPTPSGSYRQYGFGYGDRPKNTGYEGKGKVVPISPPLKKALKKKK